MKQLIEIGPQNFDENVRWLLCKWGGSKSDLGQRAFGLRLGPENGRKRMCRLQSGHVDLKIRDAEAIAEVFDVPSAVLIYGTIEQVKKSWRGE